ncbi:1016_t:CDS:2, partial [Entrophospora sp. SA101]
MGEKTDSSGRPTGVFYTLADIPDGNSTKIQARGKNITAISENDEWEIPTSLTRMFLGKSLLR